MSVVKKITVKTVCGKLAKKDIPDHGKELDLMNVYGQARRIIPSETDYGPYLRIRGTFEAMNIVTGEVFKSNTLILPDVAADLIDDVLSVEGVESADFAFKIGVRGDDDSTTGYVYYAETLMQTDNADPLALMRERLQEAKVLPAPAPAEDTAAKGKGKAASKAA